METNQSVKANILAIIILIVVSALWHPTIAKAQSLKEFHNSFMTSTLMQSKLNMNEEEAPLNINKLEITPINSELSQDVDSLKIEIDVEELRQIKIARKKALELEKKKKKKEEKLRKKPKPTKQLNKLRQNQEQVYLMTS